VGNSRIFTQENPERVKKDTEKLNFKIIHIIEKDKTWEPKKEPHELKLTCQKKIAFFIF
jgi:hypothetical protein